MCNASREILRWFRPETKMPEESKTEQEACRTCMAGLRVPADTLHIFVAGRAAETD